MSARDLMRREIVNTYRTPQERAAYRAGLSTAAAICDEQAAAVRAANPGRKRGTVSAAGGFGADIAKQCGAAITDARATISVDTKTDN